MNKNLLFILMLPLMLLFQEANAQFSPSKQVKVTAPSILSGCARDTIFVEFTNSKGPTCVASGAGPTPTVEFVVGIPDTNRISFQAASVGSTPMGAMEITQAGDSLKFTVPVPSFGSTAKAFFVLNATCDVTGLTPLPQLNFDVRYPTDMNTPDETFMSTKMNVGVGQITFTNSSGLTVTTGFGQTTNMAENITNTGFGVITELTYHQIMHDSWPGYISNRDHIYLRLLQPNDKVQNSTGAINYPDYQVTNLGNGYRYYSVTIKGDDLDEFDGQFDPGDVLRINSSYLRAPTTCVPDAIQKQWVSYKCIGGGEACEIPDTIFRTFKVSAGTPIVSAQQVAADTWDGCPNKSVSFTFKNTGDSLVGSPEVGTAYDVELGVSLGGNIVVSNLVFAGVTTVPTVQSFPGASSSITWNIKDQLTFDPDGAGGLSDLDGDGFYDDMRPGDSTNVSFEYTVDCDLACGAQLDYNINATSKYTDFCGKLNGARTTPIYRFGFRQTNAVSQPTPIPNIGALATGSKTPVDGKFTFNYRHYGMDTSQAIVTLRLNYGKNQQVTEPIRFLGQNLMLSDFTVIGSGSTDTTGGLYNNVVDNDSALEYTLSKAQIALLLDNVRDSLDYTMVHIACDSFQNQSNTAGWSLLYQINNNSCPPVPCALDLSCGKAFAYNYSEGCGSFPCFRTTDSIYRTSPWGHVTENQTTSVVPTAVGTSNFYAGDTMTQTMTAILSSDVPLMEPIGQAPVNPVSRGFYSYFSWTYDKPASMDMADLTEAYMLFVEEGSRVRVYDTTTNTLLYDLPIKMSYFNNIGTTLGNNLPDTNRAYVLYDNITNSSTYTGPDVNGVPGIGLGDHWCNTNSWTLDNGSCPYQDIRYRDLGTTFYLAFENVAKTRVSEYQYIYWEKAFIDAGISFDPGYTKYKWEVTTKWKVNPAFPHTNVSDFVRRGGISRPGNNLSRPYESRTLVGSCATATSLGTAVDKEILVEGPGADYNSSCGLTVSNKLFFESVVGDYFPSEVRVPYKLDSFVVTLPAEYHTAGITPTTLAGAGVGASTANGVSVTGTPSGGGYTGKLLFINNTGVTGTSYDDFPRISDADGIQTAWNTTYDISNAGTDNFVTEGYKVPVVYYLRDEFGNRITLIDTFTISEATPEITIAPLGGGTVQIDDGGACSNSYMDVLVSNNTIYGADNVYIAALGNANHSIVSITDAPGESPTDPIANADTNQYGMSNVYAELGGMIAGGRRIVRITFNSTACSDSIKLYTNFGCNYPVAREPNNTGNTLDSANVTYNAVPPSIMSGPVNGNKNIANLCDEVELEVEVRNVKNPNLTDIVAGFKLPPNAVYVAGSAEIAYPTNTYVAAPTVTSIGTDSIAITVSDDAELSIACGLPGSDETKFPNANLPQINSSPANVFKLRLRIDFNACPTGTSDEVFYNVQGKNYCGDSTSTQGVFNLIYTGVTTTPTTYSCVPANSTPLKVCADSGMASTVIDSVFISNTGTTVSTTADSVSITLGTDTARFDLDNFTAAAPWTNPIVTVNAEGRTILTYGIPAGVAAGDSIMMIMSYDLTPKTDNVCDAGDQTCAAIAHSMSFFSVTTVDCPAKFLTCAGVQAVSRGSGYVPRELECCKQGLGNFVWLDNDKDGIQDVGEPGVAGVTVDVYDNGPDGLPNTADDVLVGSTVTDAYGKYYFADLPTGDYNLGFTPPSNYTFTQNPTKGDNQDNTNSDVDTAAANFGRTGTYNLMAGEQDSTIDAGLVLPTPPTATIGDRVWSDDDKDGEQDVNEAGVAGVTVELLDASGNVVATTLTDANGNYLFKDVDPGTYSVKVTPPMGTTLTTTGSDGNTGGSSDSETDSDVNSDGETPQFSVAAGDNYRNVDAGIVPQSDMKSSLGDFVWYDENQDGVQDAGEVGIEGVMVILRDSIGNPLDTTFTNTNGKYSFDDLDPGTYSVRFVAPAGYSASPADSTVTLFGEGADLADSDADPVSGESGQVLLGPGRRNSTVDAGFYLPTPNLNSIGNRVWYDTDQDGVQDAGEVGAPGVTVRLLDGTGSPVNNPATGKPYVVMTDIDGNYKFVGLPDGDYQIQFDNLPAGMTFSPSNTPGDNADDTNSDADLTGRTPTFNLTGGENDMTADAGIYSGDAGLTASLGNKVFYDLNNDGIQDPDETGVAGVTVTLKDYGPDGMPGGGDDGPDRTTTTNAQGEYLFTDLPAGNYAVEFSDLPAGYAASPKGSGSDGAVDSDGNPIMGGTSTTDAVTLSAGEENLDVDLGLNKPNVNSIGNYVWIDSNNDGQQGSTEDEPPVPGVQVTLLDAAGNPWDSDPGTPGVQPYVTTTDANGKYLFTDLPDGTYSVQFSQLPDGFEFTGQNSGAAATDSDAGTDGKTGTVTVGPSNRTDLSLDAGISSPSKAVLGNYVWSDEDGDGVQDPGEKGIPGVLVTLYDASNNAIATTITDANGKYLFPNLDPGTYSVGFSNLPEGTEFTGQDATAGGGTDLNDSDVDPATGRTAPVTLAAGDVNLTLDAGVKPPPTATVGNYVWFDINQDGVQNADEPPFPGVIVTLKDGAGNVIGTTITDGDGKYLFTNVPPGTGYTVEFNTNIPDYGALSGFPVETPYFTTQTVNNPSDNGSIVPVGGANSANIGVTAPFDVAAGSHTRLQDAGVTSAFPLPVEFMYFTAILENNANARLNWATSSEYNALRYNVYRSIGTPNNFTYIGNVLAKGNSNQIENYIYNDDVTNVPSGYIYYRLIQVDINGDEFVSEVRTVLKKDKDISNSVKVLPNPASNEFEVIVDGLGDGNYELSLVDVSGKEVLNISINVLNGSGAKTIDVSSLPAGVYTLTGLNQPIRISLIK